MITLHPQPQQSLNEAGLAHYFTFLRELTAFYGDRLWRATPSQIVSRYRGALRGGDAR